eukprot:Filipodium_phascolosomae@DN2634_c0_g1_i3.p1
MLHSSQGLSSYNFMRWVLSGTSPTLILPTNLTACDSHADNNPNFESISRSAGGLLAYNCITNELSEFVKQNYQQPWRNRSSASQQNTTNCFFVTLPPRNSS